MIASLRPGGTRRRLHLEAHGMKEFAPYAPMIGRRRERSAPDAALRTGRAKVRSTACAPRCKPRVTPTFRNRDEVTRPSKFRRILGVQTLPSRRAGKDDAGARRGKRTKLREVTARAKTPAADGTLHMRRPRWPARRASHNDHPLFAFAAQAAPRAARLPAHRLCGHSDKRIAGVLLTFPILNGVAIIASPDPVAVADAIYPLVIFNCVLFALVISFPLRCRRSLRSPRAQPAHSCASRCGRRRGSPARVSSRICAPPFSGARNPVHRLSDLRGSGIHASLCWEEDAAVAGDIGRETVHAAAMDPLRIILAHQHRPWRIVLFIARAYGCLFFVSRAALDQKWVGMASALPLPGLFALAALIDEAERSADAPHAKCSRSANGVSRALLVIPFNWAFSHLLGRLDFRRTWGCALPPARLGCGRLAALAVLLLVPRVEAYFDRRFHSPHEAKAQCGNVPSPRPVRAGFRCRSIRATVPPWPHRTPATPKPPRARDLALSAAAQAQSGGLVALGPGGAGRGASAATSRSCSRSATPPATGATSWRTRASRTTRPRR